MNYKHAATILLIAPRKHVRKHGNVQRHLFHHESSILTMNITREEIVECRSDDTFQFDHSSCLVCKEVSMSNNTHISNNNANETCVNGTQLQD